MHEKKLKSTFLSPITLTMAILVIAPIAFLLSRSAARNRLPENLEQMFSGSEMILHELSIDLFSSDDPGRMIAMLNFVHHFHFEEKKEKPGNSSSFSVNFKLRFPATLKITGQDSDAYFNELRETFLDLLKSIRTVQTGVPAPLPGQTSTFQFSLIPMNRNLQKELIPLSSLATSDLFGKYEIEPESARPVGSQEKSRYFVNSKKILIDALVDTEKFSRLSVHFSVDQEKVYKTLDPVRRVVFERLMDGKIRLESKSSTLQ